MRKPISATAALLVLLTVIAGARPATAQAKSSADEAAIRALYNKFNDAFNKKDVDGIMSVYAPDVFVFDVIPPREYSGWDAYKKDWQSVFSSFAGPATNSVSDLNITVIGPVAYAHYIDDGTMTAADGTKSHMVVRSTDVWRKQNGKWLIVQEHNSFPVDLTTGKADTLSTP
jgi:uncharacterized protein (TIGR02246 family)